MKIANWPALIDWATAICTFSTSGLFRPETLGRAFCKRLCKMKISNWLALTGQLPQFALFSAKAFRFQDARRSFLQEAVKFEIFKRNPDGALC
jgi:hypothetical protein